MCRISHIACPFQKKSLFSRCCFKNPSGSDIYAGLTVLPYIRLKYVSSIVDLRLRQYCMQFFAVHSSTLVSNVFEIIILCRTINTAMKDKVILTSTDFHDVYTYTRCIIIWLSFQIVLLRQIFSIHKMKHNYIIHFLFRIIWHSLHRIKNIF
jgi:hypothetical protein